MKKVLTVFLTFAILLFSSTSVFADIATPFEDKYTYLKNMGFPESYLEKRSYAEIESMYSEFYGTDSKLTSLEYQSYTENIAFDSNITPYGCYNSQLGSLPLCTGKWFFSFLSL